MKVYRRHNCTRSHRSARTFMKCAIPKAAWIVGRGDYASIAWCDVPTVELYATQEDAERAKATIDRTGCGGRCQRRHEVVQIKRLEEMSR
jgi:hypothetical protein